MLSTSHSIKDVKRKLLNKFSDYGFDCDNVFKDFITSTADDTYLETFLPLLGVSLYTSVQDKDKTGLTEVETYIYWAEIHMICADVLNELGKKEAQMTVGTASSFSAEGYSQSVSDPGKLGYYDVSIGHWNKAKGYLAKSGYPLSNRMKRGGDFHQRDYYPGTEYLPGI